MKILKSIGLYFVYPFITFILGILTHIAYLDYFYPNKYALPKEASYIEDSSYEVSNLPQNITTCDTRYIVIEYNMDDNIENTTSNKVPDKYLGMTRANLEEALEEYILNPTLEDIEKGLIDIQLKSFSQKEVQVYKTYKTPLKNPGYYLMVQDGKIVVMEEDKETIYLTTDIYADALSDSLKQELILGKFIYNIEELYGFLESYTS